MKKSARLESSLNINDVTDTWYPCLRTVAITRPAYYGIVKERSESCELDLYQVVFHLETISIICDGKIQWLFAIQWVVAEHFRA